MRMSEPSCIDLRTTLADVEEAYEWYLQTTLDTDEVFRIEFDDGTTVDMYQTSDGWNRAMCANRFRNLFVELINVRFFECPSGLACIESRFSNGGTFYFEPANITNLYYVSFEQSNF